MTIEHSVKFKCLNMHHKELLNLVGHGVIMGKWQVVSRLLVGTVNIPKEKTCNLDYCLLATRFIYVLTRAIYCHVGLKWHSLLFGNNRKLFRVFVVVYSNLSMYVFYLIKGSLTSKIINRNV